LFYAAYSLGGWPLLYALITLIYLSAFFLVLYPAVSHFSGSFLAASLATFLAFKIGQIHFFARPVVLGFLFFAIIFYFSLWLWEAAKKNDDFNKACKYSFFTLPPLFVLWANMHPSFVMGLILLAIVPISLLVDRLVFFESNDCSKTKRLFMLLLLCAAATLINPYFFDLHLSIVWLGQSDFFMNYHMEWLSPNFKEVEGKIFQLICGLIVLSSFMTGGRMKTFPWLSLVIFALLGMRAVRVLPYFGIVSAYPLALAISGFGSSEFFRRRKVFALLSFHLSNLDRLQQYGFKGKLALLSGFLVIILGALLFNKIPGYQGHYGPSPEKFPEQALFYLRAKSNDNVVLGSFPNWGGYITLKGFPSIRAVIDDRNTMLGEQFYKDFHKSLKEPASLLSFMQANGATHLLLPKEHLMAKLLKEGKSLETLFSDEISILFALNVSSDL